MSKALAEECGIAGNHRCIHTCADAIDELIDNTMEDDWTNKSRRPHDTYTR